TSSGYARQARLWHRGTPLEDAELVHEVAESDMAVFAAHDSTPGWERDWVIEAHAFYDNTIHVVDRSQQPPALTTVDVPADLAANALRSRGIFSPRPARKVRQSRDPAASLLLLVFARSPPSHPAPPRRPEPTNPTALAHKYCTRTTVVPPILEEL